MIVFDLTCTHGHRFEGWFGSSDDFAAQQAGGLLICPQCGSAEVIKAPMSPAVPVKGNAGGRSEPARAARPSSPQPGLPATSQDSKPQRAGGGVSRAPAADHHPVSNVQMPREVEKALQALAKAQEKALEKSTWVGKDFAQESRAMHYGEADERAIHGQASMDEAEALAEEGIPIAPLPFPVAPPDELN